MTEHILNNIPEYIAHAYRLDSLWLVLEHRPHPEPLPYVVRQQLVICADSCTKDGDDCVVCYRARSPGALDQNLWLWQDQFWRGRVRGSGPRQLWLDLTLIEAL